MISRAFTRISHSELTPFRRSLPQEYHIYVPEPTADVARTITELFPAIEESLATCPSSAQTSEAFVDDRTPTKPFPLSNLALAAESASAGRELSPKIARALEQLERRDSASTVSDVKRQREVFESTLEEEEGEASASEEIIDRTPRRPSSVALSASTTSATSISSFKARPAPPLPTAEPRLTKSAALRLGVALPASTPRASTKRQSISTSERAALDRLTRRQSVQLPPAPPAKPVEVRMSKAAMLRIGMPVPDKESNRRSRQSTATSLDEALPPANRRLSVSSSLKSLREPTIAPRSTKSSALRTGKLDDSRSTNTARTRGVNILRDDQANATPKSTDQRRESVPRHPVAGARAGRASIATAARTGVSDVDFAGGMWQTLCDSCLRILLTGDEHETQFLVTNGGNRSRSRRCTSRRPTRPVRTERLSYARKGSPPVQRPQCLLTLVAKAWLRLRLLPLLPRALSLDSTVLPNFV